MSRPDRSRVGSESPLPEILVQGSGDDLVMVRAQALLVLGKLLASGPGALPLSSVGPYLLEVLSADPPVDRRLPAAGHITTRPDAPLGCFNGVPPEVFTGLLLPREGTTPGPGGWSPSYPGPPPRERRPAEERAPSMRGREAHGRAGNQSHADRYRAERRKTASHRLLTESRQPTHDPPRESQETGL